MLGHDAKERYYSIYADMGIYNELLLRKWTVGSIFYVKGSAQEYIEKLLKLAVNLSMHETINPLYRFRESNNVTKKTTKFYPVYELDPSNGSFKLVLDSERILSLAQNEISEDQSEENLNLQVKKMKAAGILEPVAKTIINKLINLKRRA